MEDRERQLGIEGARRRRVAFLSIAAGVVYLIGQLVLIEALEAKEPTVGILQGLTPAFHGLKQAAVDPRFAQQTYIDNHWYLGVLGWLLTGVGFALMSVPLGYLRSAEAVRSGRRSRVTLVLGAYLPWLLGVDSLVLATISTIEAHRFVAGADHSTAAYQATVGATPVFVGAVISALGTLLLAIAFVMISLRAMGVGLLTRAMGIVGIFAGVLFVLQVVPLPLIQLIWLVGLGMMLLEIGGLTLPPAWAAGEAIPWAPRQPATRPARGPRQRGGRREPAQAALTPSPAPPRPPSPATSKKRKRRRG